MPPRLLAVWLAAAFAWAGQTDEASQDPFFIKTTVVVTAGRTEAELEKSPASATVVPQKELEVRNARTVDQALNSIEGFYAQRTKGPADTLPRIVTRGLAGGNRTLVLLDGHPLNDAYLGDVSWTTLPVSEVERVEVARGAYSSLYGGNAMGGVINVLTRPVTSRQFEFSGQYGSYNTTQYSTRYADRFFSRLGVIAAYQRLQSGGYEPRLITASAASGAGTSVTGAVPVLAPRGTPAWIVGSAGRNWYNQESWRLKGEYTFSEASTASFQYLRQEFGYGYDAYSSWLRDASGAAVDRGAIALGSGRATLSPTSFLQGPGGGHSHFFSGTFFRKIDARRVLRASGSAYRQPQNWFATPGSGATLSGGPGSAGDRESRTYHGNLQMNWDRSSRHSVVFGTEHRNERAVNQEFFLPNYALWRDRGDRTYEAGGRSYSQAAYAQDHIRLTERLQMVAGGRIEGWQTTSVMDESVTRSRLSLDGKVSALWQAPGEWILRASAGSAFRNPTQYELYRTWQSSSGILYLANPELGSERLVSWEAGMRKRLGERLQFDGAVFDNRVTGMIYRRTDFEADPSGRRRIFVNAGEARARGAEMASRHRLASWLQVRAAYTFSDAVISRNSALPESEGKRVPGVPRHVASLLFLGVYKRWTGSLSGRYTGSVFNSDDNLDRTKGVPGSYDPFALVDATLGYEVNRRTQLFFSADNLLNRRYFLFNLSPGRTVSAGMRIRL